MPRPPRTDVVDIVYHVINRANARVQIFDTLEDYELYYLSWVNERQFSAGAEKEDRTNRWHKNYS